VRGSTVGTEAKGQRQPQDNNIGTQQDILGWNRAEHVGIRNIVEHAKDNTILLDKLDSEIILLIQQHSHQSDGAFHPSEIAKAEAADVTYTQAWIRNVQAADNIKLRKEKNDTTSQQMRNTMRVF
jgi:hypothetical protein